MAVIATFTADFRDFLAKVNDAEAALKGLGQSGEAVSKRLSAFATTFSGKRVIEDATLMAKAISDIGGAAVLTEKEAARVSRTMSDAMDKMRALGMEVPPHVAQLADETRKAGQEAKSFGSQIGKLNGLLSTFGVGLSVGAVVSFGRSVLSAGDQIQKMADQTGLGTAEVQKLQYIAGQSGSAMGSLVSAIQNLQQRLGEGNAGTIGAINQLNINLADFAKLDSYQQMTLLAERVRAVKDPTDQAALAADLFGKNWKEILPAIKSGMQELGEAAPVMADETVQALDRIGDSMESLKGHAIVLGASGVTALEAFGFAVGDMLSQFNPEHIGVRTSELLRMQAALNDPSGLAGAMQQATEASSGFAKMGIEPLRAIAVPTRHEIAMLNIQLDLQRESATKASEAAKKHAEELKKTAEEHAKMAEKIGLLNLANASPIVRQIYDPAAGELPGLAKLREYVKALDQVRAIESSIGTRGAQGLESIGKAMKLDTLSPRGLTDSLKSLVSGDVGSVFKDVTGFFKQGAGQVATGFLRGIGDMLTGGLSGLLSSGLGLLGKGISKLFGGDGKEANRMRDQFIATFNAMGKQGLDVLREKAYIAGISLDRLLDANNPKRMTAAINELTAALQFQDQAMAVLQETTEKYGFTLEELGPAFARQALDQQAQALFKDFQVLTAAGIDVDTVLSRMGESIQQFVSDALKTGTEIPAAMAPMLQRMVEMGQLTDDNGNVINDLKEAGVSFALTMSQGFQSLIGEVQKLTDAISRGLGLAIQNIPQPTINGHVSWTIDEIPSGGESVSFASRGGLVTPSGVRYMAAGGFVPRGTDTVPAMLTPGERVLSVGENQNYERGFSAMQAELRQLRVDFQAIPAAMARAMRDAVLVMG